VRGSFLASTADSIVFNNGVEFSSANPQGSSLLTVNIPVGLRFRENAGAIVNSSSVTQVIQDQTIPVGLAVPPGQTLALVGGDVIFNNGLVSAVSGNIQLGSVASPGAVSLNITPQGLGLDYTNIANFGNIELSGLSGVTASGPGGGAIALRGGNVTVRDRSSLVSDTIGSMDGRGIKIEAARFSLLDRAFLASTTSGSGAGGPIDVRTSENIELKGIGYENFRRRFLDPAAVEKPPDLAERESGITTGTLGAGPAGEIALDTKRLTLRDGSAIFNPTVGTGDGGGVTIRASESVEINASGLFTRTFNSGTAGGIAIETGQLSVTDGALVWASTLGAGNSGNLIVRASDSVILARRRSDSPLRSGLATNSIGGTGRAGNIEINTGSLRLEAGASIFSFSGLSTIERWIGVGGPGGNITVNASGSVEVLGTSADPIAGSIFPPSAIVAGTLWSSKGGDVTLNARRLIVRDGSSIDAESLGPGEVGNVTITASESVDIAGTSRDEMFPGTYPSAIFTYSANPPQDFVGPEVPFRAGGSLSTGGSLSITTDRLSVRDRAVIQVYNFRAGVAGNINVVADSIALNTQGSIDTTNISSFIGGNINLRSRDIQLRGNSRITTDAELAIAGGGGNITVNSDGGYITLNSDLLVGRNNSDITAFARSPGARPSPVPARLNINVPNILGFAPATNEQVIRRFNSILEKSGGQGLSLDEPLTSFLPTSDIADLSQNSAPALPVGVNPAQGLVEQRQNIVAPADLIAANPCRKGTESVFTVTGKGGVPASPHDTLSSAASGWTWVEEAGSSATDNVPDVTDQAPREIPDRQVVPARGWVVNAQGEVMLVANQVAGQLDDRTLPPVSVCQPR
jgi:large exoprotein involved in heme utilization and adhesion